MTPNPDPDDFARLVLLRHGETVGNQQQLWTGWTDTPLSERGREQVQHTAEWAARNGQQFVALYSSPIGRAKQTAQAVGKAIGLNPVLDDALKEMHFGDLETIHSERFPVEYPKLFSRWQNRTDESFGWPGGETRRAFRYRVGQAMLRLATLYRGEAVLVVTHSGVIRMALAHLQPARFGEWWKVELGNCGFTHLQLNPNGTARVPILNDVGHLIEEGLGG